MNVKMTFTIPEETADRLRGAIARSKRSGFVASALKEKLQSMEDETLKQDLVQGYIERLEEDRMFNQEWESATLEAWP